MGLVDGRLELEGDVWMCVRRGRDGFGFGLE